MKFSHTSNQKGVIALITVIIVASITTVYGLSIALMNIDEVQIQLAWLHSSKSRSFTSACVDNALLRLRNNTALSGNVNLSISNVTCESVISGSGNTRTILSSATSTDPLSRAITDRSTVNVNIDTNPFTIIDYKDILQ